MTLCFLAYWQCFLSVGYKTASKYKSLRAIRFFHTARKQESQLTLLGGKTVCFPNNPRLGCWDFAVRKVSLVCTEKLLCSVPTLCFIAGFLFLQPELGTLTFTQRVSSAEILYVEWLTRDQGTLWRYLLLRVPRFSIHCQDTASISSSKCHAHNSSAVGVKT